MTVLDRVKGLPLLAMPSGITTSARTRPLVHIPAATFPSVSSPVLGTACSCSRLCPLVSKSTPRY